MRGRSVAAAVLGSLVTASGLIGAVAGPVHADPAGQVTAWGKGGSGQLGNGADTDSTAAVSVLSTGALAGRTVVQVDAGGTHACAVTADGLVACWGGNRYGQLGIGSTKDESAPHLVSGGALSGKRVRKVSAGGGHTCALTTDGLLACWGNNWRGQLGNTKHSTWMHSLAGEYSVPVRVSTAGKMGRGRVTEVSAGEFHTCAVASGRAFCWGYNASGQLGNGTRKYATRPSAVLTRAPSPLRGTTVSQVSAGTDHTCAVTAGGEVACWGMGYRGALGTGNEKRTSTPQRVAQGALAGRAVTQISAGHNVTCATTADGAATCWGDNDVGQVGDGSREGKSLLPTLVSTTGASAFAGRTVSQVSVGVEHACGVATDGTVACWGNSVGGRLGIPVPVACGRDDCSPVPVSVTGTPGSGVMAGAFAVAVSAGGAFTVALTRSTPSAPTEALARAAASRARLVPSEASAPGLETGEVLAEAAWATTALAQDGIDVKQVVTFSKAVNLFDALVPRIDARVPAGSTLRVHGAMAADRRTSYVVRDAKGRLIAGMGRTGIADGGEWATPSAIRLDGDLEGFARDRRISRTTAITGLDSGRLGARAILGPDDAVTDVVNLVVPPYADQAFVWSTLSQGIDSSGRVVITGAKEEPDLEEDDPCTHVDVRAVIGANGAIEMAEWTDVCPGRGRVHFSATATFGSPVIDPPTRPRLTLDAAMARRSKGLTRTGRRLRERPRARCSGRPRV